MSLPAVKSLTPSPQGCQCVDFAKDSKITFAQENRAASKEGGRVRLPSNFQTCMAHAELPDVSRMPKGTSVRVRSVGNTRPSLRSDRSESDRSFLRSNLQNWRKRQENRGNRRHWRILFERNLRNAIAEHGPAGFDFPLDLTWRPTSELDVLLLEFGQLFRPLREDRLTRRVIVRIIGIGILHKSAGGLLAGAARLLSG
jgi:hypothetical protein